MDFHYYYIIQDVVGVLMVFLGIRMLMLSIRMTFAEKKSRNITSFFIKYTLITLAGLNFLISSFGLRPWIISIILVILSMIITSEKKKYNI